MELKDYISFLLAIIGLFGVGGIALYRKHILKLNQDNIAKSFAETVSKLSSSSTSEMYSSAILLRRYFDKNSSFGIGGAPLAKDTINVISSMLRIDNIDPHLQKILADSLKEAPDLIKADFQGVNLYKAVLGKKNLDMTGADFYKADLSSASFKDKDSEENGVILKKAVFSGAILNKTNFTGADLKEANFSGAILNKTNFTGADLVGANFSGALLNKTNFTGADLAGANFEDANFIDPNFNKCKHKPQEIVDYENSTKTSKVKNIFISHPNPKRQTLEQQVVYNSIMHQLKECKINAIELSYTPDRNERLDKFISNIEGSNGMLVFDFKRFKVTEGQYLPNGGLTDKETIGHVSSRWVYLEAGMGLMRKLPTFIVTDLEDKECIFNGIITKNIAKIENCNNNNLISLNKKIEAWVEKIG